MPVIYLVQALDPHTGPFIHESSFAGGGLRELVQDLVTGQFKGPGATQPIQAIYRFDTDAMSIEDASEAVLILVDAEAERLWIDNLPPLLDRWRDEHMARKAAAIAAPMKALTNLLASLTADPKAGITHGL